MQKIKEMAYVSTIISGAASLGVLIGLISGIFFLVLSALRWVTRVRGSLYEEELRRRKQFLINETFLPDAGASNFLNPRKEENDFGNTLNGNKLQEKINEKFQSNVDSAPQWTEQTESRVPDQGDPSTDTIKVRELIEKMVEKMIEGPLDGTTVGQLSTRSAYLDMFTKYHNSLCRELARLGYALHLSAVRKNELEADSLEMNQSNLKRLIKRIVAEAMSLPDIRENSCRPKALKAATNEDFKNKSYEDILATAILNKVIENFQKKNYREKDSNDGHPKPRLRSKKLKKAIDSIDTKSDDDWSDTSRSDQLSLTIEEYIEEVTTALEASDDERSELSDFETTINRRIPFPESGRTVVDAVTDDENSDLDEQNTVTDLITSSSSWEENWLFQKKRLRSTPNAHHPVPVPMLVPNPSEDFRALVGGVDADDLSDMSDCADSILEDFNAEETQLNNAETEKEIHEEEEEGKKNLQETDIHVVEESFDERKQEDIQDFRISNPQENVALLEENQEQVSEEIAETLGSPSVSDNFPQQDRESSIVDFSHQYEMSSATSSLEEIDKTSPNTECEENSIRCPLAEREREKWLHPVPLAENPYSLENIAKREQRKKTEYFRIGTFTGETIDFPEDISSDEFSRKEAEKLRFSRDYYINASKHPAGMPSLSHHPEESEQVSKDMWESVQEEPREFEKMEKKRINETSNPRKIDKTQFCLPSVKELAKQFSKEDHTELNTQNYSSKNKSKSVNKSPHAKTNELPEKELEVDYSTVPISEIILHLKEAAEAPPKDKQYKNILYTHSDAITQMEICRKVDSKEIIENGKKLDKIEPVRFNGKEVHSLTARSISKEFREGLKNSNRKNHHKNDRCSGESENGDIVCSKIKTSPTPSIDLKNMKKFWEEIITANSNSTKQK